MRNNKLLEEARKIVQENEDKGINYIGPKPWYLRALTKLRMGMMISSVVGFSGFAAVNINMDNIHMPSFEKDVVVQQNVSGGAIKESKFISDVEQMKLDFPSIDFESLKTQRDVSKAFIGKNNFLALAAEMEGFRGDLHKDPATGLNIGFGYNISKRIGQSETEVVKDLISIGVESDTISEIVKIAKKPQSKLKEEIKSFNKKHNLEKNQLISLEQGVALLKRTQIEYRNQASNCFPTFSKMDKNQQEVLTYAAYKAGGEALSKYKKAIQNANIIYNKNKPVSFDDLKSIAKQLTFYYAKDGKEMVLDERATLIAQTFIHQDYLAVQIGKNDAVENNQKTLVKHKIDFSHLETTLVKNEVKGNSSAARGIGLNKAALDKVRLASANLNKNKKVF